MNAVKTLLALTLLASGSIAAGEVAYRWVDEHGVTHFSDRPPERAAQVETVALPEYAVPATFTYSYVALLDRLRAMEAELEEVRRQRERPVTVVVPYPVREPETTVIRSGFPHFARRPFFAHPPVRPAPERTRDSRSSFDRLIETRRGPSDPPGG